MHFRILAQNRIILFLLLLNISKPGIFAQQAGLSVTPEILTSGIISSDGYGYGIDGYCQMQLSKILFIRVGINYELISEQYIPTSWIGGGINDIVYPDFLKTRFAKAGVPIIVGVHLNSYRPMFPKFRYYLFAGYQASLALPSRTVSYYSGSTEKSEKENNYDFYLDEKMIQSFMIGFDFAFQIDAKFCIFFSPEFKNTFIDFSMDDQMSFGLKTGARYNFNN